MDFRKTRGHPFSASLQCIHGHSRPASLLPLPRPRHLHALRHAPHLLRGGAALLKLGPLPAQHQHVPGGLGGAAGAACLLALVQQILCAGLTPSCSQGRVTKVPRAYCRATLKPCKVLDQVSQGPPPPPASPPSPRSSPPCPTSWTAPTTGCTATSAPRTPTASGPSSTPSAAACRRSCTQTSPLPLLPPHRLKLPPRHKLGSQTRCTQTNS